MPLIIQNDYCRLIVTFNNVTLSCSSSNYASHFFHAIFSSQAFFDYFSTDFASSDTIDRLGIMFVIDFYFHTSLPLSREKIVMKMKRDLLRGRSRHCIVGRKRNSYLFLSDDTVKHTKHTKRHTHIQHTYVQSTPTQHKITCSVRVRVHT